MENSCSDVLSLFCESHQQCLTAFRIPAAPCHPICFMLRLTLVVAHEFKYSSQLNGVLLLGTQQDFALCVILHQCARKSEEL